MATANVEYDKYGRMKYNPELHGEHGTPWTTTDEKYLIERYELDGPEEVSLSLERTIHTVMERARLLRSKGRMAKPVEKSYHKRTFSRQCEIE